MCDRHLTNLTFINIVFDVTKAKEDLYDDHYIITLIGFWHKSSKGVFIRHLCRNIAGHFTSEVQTNSMESIIFWRRFGLSAWHGTTGTGGKINAKY